MLHNLSRELAITIVTMLVVTTMLAVAPSITTGLIAITISSTLNLWLVAPWLRS